MIKTNTIINGNSLAVLKTFPDKCIDLIFADPPYFMQLGGDLLRPDATLVNAVTDKWDKFSDFKAYDDFTNEWLTEAHRVLKDTGTLWVIGSYHNIYRVGYALQNLGFWMLNDVVWVKSNPMPNFKGTRLTNAHETLIWCAKSNKAKYTFNYESMKAFNDGLQMRSDWYFPICNGAERLKGEDGKKVHTTQKPESLLYQVILASTNVGDVILDPFFGTGTTGVVAKKLGRQYIGIEREKTYIKHAQKRLNAIKTTQDSTLLDAMPCRKTEPRIAFGRLLADGLLKPGDKLTDAKRRFSAIVTADGLLQYKRKKLSIHQLAAQVQGVSSSNGWTYWHTTRGTFKKLVVIDELRQQIKNNMIIE